jgi:Sec-independent protein translocase protein TatA
MFGISFFELLVIIGVIVLITRPKDIPVLIKHCKKLQKDFHHLKHECTKAVTDTFDDKPTKKRPKRS